VANQEHIQSSVCTLSEFWSVLDGVYLPLLPHGFMCYWLQAVFITVCAKVLDTMTFDITFYHCGYHPLLTIL